MLGIVMNYRSYASLITHFLREYNVSCFINTELYPISEHMLQVILHMVERLKSKDS